MLTDIQIRNAKPPEDGRKRYKLYDAKGLYLEVTKAGSKRWRFRYKCKGKESLVSLGLYPEVSLKEARKNAQEKRSMVLEGINPAMARNANRETGVTVKDVALEWMEKESTRWSASHERTVRQRIEANIFPTIGKLSIKDIEPPDLLRALRKVEERGALEQAKRILGICSQIWRYGVASCYCQRDIAADLKGALQRPIMKNFPTITEPAEIGKLLRDIDAYGGFIPKKAIQFQMLTMTRPGETRFLEWGEIDFGNALWTLPAERMKKSKQHIVPLPDQAVKILEDVQELTGRGQYAFTAHNRNTPISENTMNQALRRMGWSGDKIVSHGFRAMASTLLNEMGYDPDLIETQLAHVGKDRVRAAYCRAEYIDKRRSMLQAWADYLDGLLAGGKVIPIWQAQ